MINHKFIPFFYLALSLWIELLCIKYIDCQKRDLNVDLVQLHGTF